MRKRRGPVSLRRLLFFEFLGVAVVLAALLYLAVRFVAGQAADQMQDNLLAASALTIAERLALNQDRVELDLPYSALDMLGVSGQERVFYRVRNVAGQEITGYADLPPADPAGMEGKPAFATRDYNGARVRVATVRSTLASRRQPVAVDVTVAQTRESLDDLSGFVALAALSVGLGFMLIAAVLGYFAVNRALTPLRHLARAMERRPPHQLEPFEENAPREVRPLVDSINRFMSRLRSNLDVTEQFIADAAHRIRTPMAAVRVQAELAAREAHEVGREETFSRLVHSVDEVTQLTNQLLSNATVRYRGDRGEHQDVDLFDVAHAAIGDLRVTAERKSISIVVREEPDANLCTRGDPLSILEAVRNIVDNAIKYCPPSSQVIVSLQGTTDRVRLAVADNGPGIPPHQREQVLERFQRGAHSDGVVGSGLGLYITAQVMHAHGGTIQVMDNAEHGARIILDFPAA